MLFGLEAEYLLIDDDIGDLLERDLPVTSEFFRCMAEIITAPYAIPSDAVQSLELQVRAVEAAGIVLGQYASFATRPQPDLSMAHVTKDTPYYRWVFADACQAADVHPWDLHHVGIHVNLSDERLVGDTLIHATNWLRCLTPLFILFTANSPFEDGRPCGALSRRMDRFPNRYDVPLWTSEVDCQDWLRQEEAAARIYPGKARCWMPVAPRCSSLDEQFTRVEVRSLDSGRGVPFSVIGGCCQLTARIVEHALTGVALPIRPYEMALLGHNDRAAARFGRHAHVCLNGREQSILKLAWQWADGIPELVAVLRDSSPAEVALRGLPKSCH